MGEWERASCRRGGGHDAETWFPEKGNRGYRATVDRARKICWDCPVISKCAIRALRLEDDRLLAGGIWAGENLGGSRTEREVALNKLRVLAALPRSA